MVRGVGWGEQRLGCDAVAAIERQLSRVARAAPALLTAVVGDKRYQVMVISHSPMRKRTVG